METSYRPLSKRQRRDLAGYVSVGPALFRATLFVVAVAAIGAVLRAMHRQFVRGSLDSDLVWIIPTLAFAWWLYRRSVRWTGGRALRDAVRRDLERGEVAVHRIQAVDAVEIEEQGDSGPSYFVLDDTGSVFLFAGQYLDMVRKKGFPWTTIEVVEAPTSKRFIRVESAGEPLVPSVRHASFPRDQLRAVVAIPREWGIVDLDFDAVKQGRVQRAGA